ncbi:hypothetical protein K440DRAFT_574087, partial [Wilcoxina mikolae CBS 423.85]
WYEERKKYQVDKEWANYGFTDEMSIEVGGIHGVCIVWRTKDERWEDDCVGAMKKQGPAAMCWGMIGWNYKGPFYVWDPETKEEREHAHNEITQLNKERKLEAILKYEEWKNSIEFKQLKARKLAAR